MGAESDKRAEMATQNYVYVGCQEGIWGLPMAIIDEGMAVSESMSCILSLPRETKKFKG